MNTLRIMIPLTAMMVSLLFSGCQMMSNGSSSTSMLRMPSLGGPPRQSEPEILENDSVSSQTELAMDELTRGESAPPSRDSEQRPKGATAGAKSLPVTESRPAITDEQLDIADFAGAG